MPKLMLLMIDGVAAEHYALDSGRFPNFALLEKRGFRIERLHSEVLGTSLPGRTSILTGVTADVSGVYANKMWDGESFRYANPDDIRVMTLPARARTAGLDVAVIGMGMIKPEDADIFHGPWWSSGFIQRARDAEPTPADHAWMRVAMATPGERFERICAAAGIPSTLPTVNLADESQRPMMGVMADLMMFDWVGALAASDEGPQVIFSEFLLPDIFQHNFGFRSDLAHWSVAQADAALGRILRALENAGKLDEWNIVVLSDHGHSVIEKALQPQVIIPGVRTQSEGSCLLVAPRSKEELDDVTAKLAAYGCEPYTNQCVPEEYRDQVYIFVSPERVSFEQDNLDTTEPILPPKAISSHGLRPGAAGDDRFALFAGPQVPHGKAAEADANQVAPTIAALLSIGQDGFTAHPMFEPVVTATP